MDLKNFISDMSLSHFPIALGGCRSDGNSLECCEYNVTVFDDKKNETVYEREGELIRLHHGSLLETDPSVLKQYENLNIISDEQWSLRMFLNKIKENNPKITKSYARSCLVDAGIFAIKAKEGIKIADPFVPVWVKCSAYSLSEAVLLLNFTRPSPLHMLEFLRSLEKNKINNNFEVIHQCLGIERASTSLLNRMAKSSIGFSDLTEANDHSKVIERKYKYLAKNSLLADCYFYLGYICRNNLIKVNESALRKNDFIHVLRVALDVEKDPLVLDKQSFLLLKTANEILSLSKD